MFWRHSFRNKLIKEVCIEYMSTFVADASVFSFAFKIVRVCFPLPLCLFFYICTCFVFWIAISLVFREKWFVKTWKRVAKRESLFGTLSRQGKAISFYKFPKNENLKQQWLLKIKRINIQLMQHARICHLHFERDCFKHDLQVRKYSLNFWSICVFTSNLRCSNEKLFKKYPYSADIVAYFKSSFP